MTAGLAVDRIVAGAVVAGCGRRGGLTAGGDGGGVQRRAGLGPLQAIDGGVAARGHRIGDRRLGRGLGLSLRGLLRDGRRLGLPLWFRRGLRRFVSGFRRMGIGTRVTTIWRYSMRRRTSATAADPASVTGSTRWSAAITTSPAISRTGARIAATRAAGSAVIMQTESDIVRDVRAPALDIDAEPT